MNKKSLAGLVIVFGLTLGLLWTSPSIRELRSVDLLLIFSSGMLFGVLLASFLHRLRATKNRP
ncbi:MAG: hypothetical protein PVG07_02645 [Acidobacteriota bacterium]|jgi:hypothetical protein